MARLLTHALAEQLKSLALAPAQFIVLVDLWVGEAVTQRELMLRLDVGQATIGNALTRMERDGLKTRDRHPDDNRGQLIRARHVRRRWSSFRKTPHGASMLLRRSI